MGSMIPGSGSSYGSRSQPTLNEINVTPLVDVMLVLLIVFMVTAPLMQQGVDVNLPKATTGAIKAQQDPFILTITSAKKILINKNEIPLKDLGGKLGGIFSAKSNKQVYIHADEAVPYGLVAQVIAEVKKIGIEQVGLVTIPE